MRKVVATEYVTLDGVMEEPGNWSFPFWNDETAKCKFDELFASDALLLGRVTYEGFAKAWPSMTDEQGFADRMNGLPKYVVSTTLEAPEWNNSHLIKENIPEEVAKLKRQPGQDILLAGSGRLLHTLMEHGLVDEYRFMLYPIVLGGDLPFFPPSADAINLRLMETHRFGSGVIYLRYRRADDGQ